jgi:hypothetical protein
MSPSDPDGLIYSPYIPLQITVTPIVAKPRKLKTLWPAEAADELKGIWGGGPTRPDNALDIFIQGLDDPEFNPNVPYKGRRDHSDDLIEAMAKEMSDEIDREIIKSVLMKVKPPKVP